MQKLCFEQIPIFGQNRFHSNEEISSNKKSKMFQKVRTSLLAHFNFEFSFKSSNILLSGKHLMQHSERFFTETQKLTHFQKV